MWDSRRRTAMAVRVRGNRLLREMIRNVFYGYGNTNAQHAIPKKAVHKILFNVSRSLPDHSPARDAIPFYWFLEGPYSEPIAREITAMASDGTLLRTDNPPECYSYNPDRVNKRLLNHGKEGFEDVRGLISDAVRNAPRCGSTGPVREIYRNSPILFYPIYGGGFMVNFDTYRESHGRAAGQAGGVTESSLISDLERSSLSIPTSQAFHGFRITFSKFAQLARDTLRSAGRQNRAHAGALEDLARLSGKTWRAFACGARIVEHDAYYGGRLAEWGARFAAETRDLDVLVDRATRSVGAMIGAAEGGDGRAREMAFRLRLARSIGLDRLPDPDPDALDRLARTLSGVLPEGADPVEAIREIREEGTD